MMGTQTPPGWYLNPEPEEETQLRYWDGTQWTEYTHSPIQHTEPVPTPKRRRMAVWALSTLAALLMLLMGLGLIAGEKSNISNQPAKLTTTTNLNGATAEDRYACGAYRQFIAQDHSTLYEYQRWAQQLTGYSPTYEIREAVRVFAAVIETTSAYLRESDIRFIYNSASVVNAACAAKGL